MKLDVAGEHCKKFIGCGRQVVRHVRICKCSLYKLNFCTLNKNMSIKINGMN